MIEYIRRSARISRYAGVPFPLTLGRMLLGRLLHDRGPMEFDTFQFAAKPVAQWHTYLPDRERYRLQAAVSPPAERALEENKLLFWKHCTTHGFPCAPISGIIPNRAKPVDLSAVPTLRSFATEAALAAYFAELGHFEGFGKPIGGGQGYGAFAFTVRDGKLVASARHADVGQLFAECTTSRFPGGGYLLQPRLSPHPAMRPFMPGPGLGTVRVFSFLTASGGVEVPFAGLRVPAPRALCDNFSYGSLGVPVDVSTGRLGVAVGVTADTPISHFVERHPETGATFAGQQIPFWSELLTLVEAAARAFRGLPALGWDIAICQDGPLLLETNWAFGADIAERLTNRGWARELRAWYARYASP